MYREISSWGGEGREALRNDIEKILRSFGRPVALHFATPKYFQAKANYLLRCLASVLAVLKGCRKAKKWKPIEAKKEEAG